MPTPTPASKHFLLGVTLCLGFVLVSTVVIGLLLPAFIESQLPKVFANITGKPTRIKKVDFSVMPLSLGITGFAIEAQTGRPIVSFERLDVEFNLVASVRQRVLVITKLTVQNPVVAVAKDLHGTLNIAEWVDELRRGEGDGGLFPVLVNRLHVHDGKVSYSDTQHKQDLMFYPINFTADGFSTHAGAARAVLAVSLDTGATAAWTGTLGINPARSEGSLKLSRIDLQKTLVPLGVDFLSGTLEATLAYQADYGDKGLTLAINQAKIGVDSLVYQQQGRSVAISRFEHESKLALKHQNGLLNCVATHARLKAQGLHYQQPDLDFTLSELHHETEFTLTYQHSQLTVTASKAEIAGQDFSLRLPLLAQAKTVALNSPYKLSPSAHATNLTVEKGSLTAEGLKIFQGAAQQPVLDAAVFKAYAIDLDYLKRQLSIGSVNIGQVSGALELNPDGHLNYQNLLSTLENAPAVNPEQKTATTKKIWQVAVAHIALNDSALRFTDRRLPSPLTISLKPVALTLAGYHSGHHDPLPVTFKAHVNGSGTADISGTLTMSPPQAQLHVNLKNIDLEKFNGYFSKMVRLSLIDGQAHLDGHVKVAVQEPLAVQFKGNLTVANWLTRDLRVFKDFITWKNLALTGISLDTLENHYKVENLVLDKPYARVTIRKDNTSNFDNLWIGQEKTAKKKYHADSTKAIPVQFRVDKIRVQGGASDFTDLSLILPFSAYIQDLQGGAAGVSSEKNSTIKIHLSGNAYDLAPVKIAGNISPYLGDYDIQMQFAGLPMPLVSPYVVQFAGYKVEKGKMSLNLTYQVSRHKLTAHNRLQIDQFELGEKVDNPHAVALPLKMAVALLKDANGRIKFDFPITGSLEDPKYSIGTLITGALSNALLHMVSSPFALIASLIDTDGDVNTVNFSPGKADLTSTERSKLNGIAGVLNERTALTIGIKGVTYQQQDWPAIRDDALFDQLRQRRADEINQTAEVKIRAEYVSLSDDEQKRLMAQMFMEKFPNLAELSFFGPRLKAGQTGDFYAVAKKKLIDIISPEEQRLKELSIARAKTITKHLIKHGKIPQNRIYILDPLVDHKKNAVAIASLLTLKAE